MLELRRPALSVWIPPLAAALVAYAIGRVQPLASPLLVALLLGAVVSNSPLSGHASLRGHAAATKLLLRVGVVFLGFRLPLQDILALGPRGLVVIVLTVVATFTATCFLGDRLGLDRGLVSMIAAGFAICGASAIAAVEGGVRRRTEDVALAIAMVTLFGSVMIVLLPITAGLLGLTDRQQGVWAGASIHEVAQVVAAATTAGAAAVAIATTIKLGRVALLAFAYLAARRRDGDPDAAEAKAPLVPWFLTGFLLAAAVRTLDVLPAGVLEVANVATTLLLAAAMFGLGLGMRFRSLFPVPVRVFGLAASSTAIAASVSLTATLLLF